jgi:hypothetical protein
MKKILAWWDKHFLNAELMASLIITILLLYFLNCFADSPSDWVVLKDLRPTLYSTFASIFGSLLGFTITAGAAAFGAIETERFTLLRESSVFPKFWHVFYAAGRSTALATICCVIALIVDREKQPIAWPFYLVVFCCLLASFRVARSAWLLFYVVKIASRHRK